MVLLGGAGPEYSHLTLSWVYDWMAQGVPVVAMHRSTAWTTTDGLRVDTGMYLIGMEETSGRKANAVGKPAPEGFLAAASRLGVDPEEMYMVGDDLNNDVLAAQVVGMVGVLVRTGKFHRTRWIGGRRRIRDAAQPRARLGGRRAGVAWAVAIIPARGLVCIGVTIENITASINIAAPAETVFDVLADPSTHEAIDGTGWVRQPLDGKQLTETGQIFRMAMYRRITPTRTTRWPTRWWRSNRRGHRVGARPGR